MKEAKREVNQNTESFSLDEIKDTSKVVVKEEKNKNNTLWAKILLVILVVFASWLSLTKFAIYLDEPKTIFLKTAEVFQEDFSSIMTELENMKLLKVLNSDGVEIISDIKVNANNLVGDLKGLDAIINSLDYTANTRINKSNGYNSTKLKMRKDSIDKMNLDFLYSKNTSYIQSNNISNNYIELDRGYIDLLASEQGKNIILSDFIKKEVVKLVDSKKIISREESIAINNKTVDCNKSTYVINSVELSTLIDNIVYSLQSNGDVYNYVANILKVKQSELPKKINEIKNDLSIGKMTFEMSSYISKTSYEPVRLEMISDDKSLVLCYSRDFNYSQIDILLGKCKLSITLTGALNNKYILSIKDKDNTTVITSTIKGESREGIIKQISNETKNTKFNCNFNYMIKAQSDVLDSLSFSLDVDLFDGNESGNLNVSISSLVNKKIDIEELVVKTSEPLSQFLKENKSLKDSIIDSIRNINLANPPLENLPSVFTQ